MSEINEKNFLDQLISKAKKQGADFVGATFSKGKSLSVRVSQNELESMEESNAIEFAIKVIVGKSAATISSTNLTEKSIDLTIQRAIEAAKSMPDDPELIFAHKDQLFNEYVDLNLFDETKLSPAKLIEDAKKAEAAALENSSIYKTEFAETEQGFSHSFYATSEGLTNHKLSSGFSTAVSAIAKKGEEMQTDHDHDFKRHYNELKSPELIGKEAAQKAMSKLGAEQMATGKYPIVFSKEVSSLIPSMLAKAINGRAISLETSMLVGKMGDLLFPENINIIDNPLMPKGLASKHFDGEGLKTAKKHLIENGHLINWLLDLKAAKKLGLTPNASASGGISSSAHPSSTNLYIENGKISKEDLISPIKKGLYVTSLFSGVSNTLNGDFSRAAIGFLIEDGKITRPISNVSIAGNILEMFAKIQIANDLEFRFGTDAPTILIPEMSVAGK